MLSDFPALDLSDDACSIVYLVFLNSCQGFSSAVNACHRRYDCLCHPCFDITSSCENVCVQSTRRDVEEDVVQTEGHILSLMGPVLSYECQLGTLPGCQYSVLMRGCRFSLRQMTLCLVRIPAC